MAGLEERQHESFKTPTNKEVKVWRYMDLAKYLEILQRRGLFLPRATLLGDPFEGSSTKPTVAFRQHILKNRGTYPALAMYKDLPDRFFEMGDFYKRMIETYMVCCWHMNEYESAAMWSLYSRSSEAICIQSTYRRLRSCLPKCVFLGEVQYIDYNTDSFYIYQLLNFIVHKRKSFEHERELRAVFWTMDGSPEANPYKSRIEAAGLLIGVDLPALIERVYVSPSALPWFAAVVQEATSRYDLSFPVVQSALSESAVY